MPAAAKKLVRKAGCERGSSRYKTKAVDTEGGGEDHSADEQYKRCKGKGKNKSSSTSSMAAAAVAKTSKNNVAVLKQQVGKPNASNKASKTKKANPAEEKDQDHESKSNSKEQSLSYFPSAPKSHKMIQEQQAEQQDHDYRGTRATTSGCGVEIQIMKTDGDGVLGQEDQQLSTGFGLTSTAAGGFFSTTASTSMVCGRGGGSAEGVEHNMASLKTLHLQKKSSIGGGNTNVVLFGEAVVLAGPGGGGDGHDKQDDVEGKKNNSKSVKLQVQVDNDLELDELAAPKIVEPAQPAAAKMKRMARKMVHDLKSQADALGVEDHEDDHASTFVVVEKNAHLSAATGGGAPGEEPPTKKRRGNYSKPAMKKVSKSKGKERGGAAALDVVEVKGRKRSASANVGVSSDFAVHVEEKNVESNFYYVRCEHSVTCGGIVKVAKDDPKLLKLKTELVNPSCVMLSATTASAATSSSTAKELQQDAGSHSKSEGSSMNKSSSSTAAPRSSSAASSASPPGKLETDDIWECEACAKLWRCWGATTDCRRRVPKFASYCEQCEAVIAFNCDLNCVEGRGGNCVDECCGLDGGRINITAASQASSLGGNKTIRRLSIESIEGRMKSNKNKK
mmetsp:Transcript_13514/g.33182  ORF Transcript_13514/g.33182 Transcript_13514/m.33182 type:complete len:619 (-) Transcript_13514:625-2481(-)|eukprot:CAMPEP_0178998174 /NCGR_PEP_ID=MMETSP0795-20121207/9378_1 /TAXON_ID=88552 /ORGANISM="Amoebophrya sp., Strain Ameob2" /LENGTH=618 /DNA_ID=CAMNT_0020690847 /DNA_START=119 /DNA_END=1975 /DNA_ORIENTATION=+